MNQCSQSEFDFDSYIFNRNSSFRCLFLWARKDSDTCNISICCCCDLYSCKQGLFAAICFMVNTSCDSCNARSKRSKSILDMARRRNFVSRCNLGIPCRIFRFAIWLARKGFCAGDLDSNRSHDLLRYWGFHTLKSSTSRRISLFFHRRIGLPSLP